MQNRSEIISEYFQLMRKLSGPNKTSNQIKSNQKSKLDFEVIQSEKDNLQFLAQVISNGEILSLLLCAYKSFLSWQSLGYSGFPAFESYVSADLRKIHSELCLDKNAEVVLENKNEILKKFRSNLRSLGIPKD